MPLPIIIALAFVVCYVGYQAYQSAKVTRKEKTEKTPKSDSSPPKNGGEENKSSTTPAKSLGWFGRTVIILLIIAVVAVVTVLVTNWSKTKVAEANARAVQNTPRGVIASPVPTPSNVWDWTWETFNGEWIHGRQRNAENETKAEMYPQANGDIYFDVPYIEYRTPQRERVRLVKIEGRTWLGDRDQDYPRDHSRVRLDEIVPGEAYSGTITWPNGVMASCKLIKRK